ncbi:septum formation family protein [Nocardioides baculatus]|uniref:Septum formation family protein n=1 Tax=Nocardioides baculatus TaxID=2801337 RepID=A0ABS1LE37_9ACTN|nr:septum formation family protein [Nocardioides baculatus]MBL0749197.1 septum formation family protein [Nocardioides baculatus]
MSSHTTRSTWSVIATAIALLLSAPSILPANAAPADDPLAGAAAVGECRAYTIKDFESAHESSAAVDCAGPHTALVVAVKIVPKRVKLSGAPSAGLQRFVTKACNDAWGNAIGAGHKQGHLVVYTRSWFTPTKSQLAAGARWVRCDVNAYDDKQLGNLPPVTPFVDGGIDAGDRRCLTGKLNVVPCTASHQWISRGIVKMPDGRYSVARQDAFAKRRCPSAIQKRVDKRFLWWRVSESSWRSGERHITCYGNGG